MEEIASKIKTQNEVNRPLGFLVRFQTEAEFFA